MREIISRRRRRRSIRRRKYLCYVYYGPACNVTGKALADKLNELAMERGIRIEGREPEFRARRHIREVQHPRVVVRWGNAEPAVWSGEPDLIINTPEAILLSSSKLRSLYTLRENEVRVPPFGRDLDEYRSNVTAMRFPIIYRGIHHRRGNNLWFIESEEELNNFEIPCIGYFIKYIRPRWEYRILAYKGQIIDALYKFGGEGRVRNHRFGWRMCRMQSEGRAVKDVGIRALNAIGLDTGAVDIVKSQMNNYYVLEVNSAPGLDNRHQTGFAGAILEDIITTKEGNGAEVSYNEEGGCLCAV